MPDVELKESRSLNEKKEPGQEDPFHCEEFEGCEPNFCAYPGEEHCALGMHSDKEEEAAP